MQCSNGNKMHQFIIPSDLLDDIASRFLLDAPDSELSDSISLCFLTELAYWFYLDEYVEEDNSLDTLKFDPFAIQLLKHINLKPKKGTTEEMLQEFREFKLKVPTYGALLLNSECTYVLLVQGFWHRASWGFPKGKINVDEEPHKCAIREVLEETGYDISSKINKNNCIETTIGEQKICLYIITDVPMNTEFVPHTKGEIKEFKWFPINQLPAHKNDRSLPKRTGTTNMFYMVMPFVKPLREWLAAKSRGSTILTDKGGNTRESRRRHRSLNNADSFIKNYNNSPCPSADFSKNKAIHPSYFGQQEMLTADKMQGSLESSQKKKEIRTKGKGKKNAHQETPDEVSQQKFTFKSRGKSKGSGSSSRNTQNSDVAISNDKDYKGTLEFRSYSWRNFRINRKAINEALDKAWLGVTLQPVH